jgi:hypothetical protein
LGGTDKLAAVLALNTQEDPEFNIEFHFSMMTDDDGMGILASDGNSPFLEVI